MRPGLQSDNDGQPRGQAERGHDFRTFKPASADCDCRQQPAQDALPIAQTCSSRVAADTQSQGQNRRLRQNQKVRAADAVQDSRNDLKSPMQVDPTVAVIGERIEIVPWN